MITASKRLILILLIFTSFTLFGEEYTDNSEKDRGIVYLPLIGYSPETSLAMALAISAYNNPDPENPEQKHDTAIAAISYTLKNQASIALGGEKYFNGNLNNISAGIAFTNSQNSFYGTGINVTDEMEEEYSETSLETNLSLMSEITDSIYFGPVFIFYTDELSEKEKTLASDEIPGSEGITQTGGGAVIKIDTRDSFSYPLSGFLYTLKWEIFNENAASDYSYNRLELDLRNYFQISGNHVIGINTLYEMTAGDVPFQKLPLLGIMRGFLLSKYRDKHLAVLQAEYRFPISGRFGGVLFTGAGTIAPDINEFDFSEIKTAAGAGLRFNLDKKQHLNLRFDLAYNNDNQTQFYMSLMEAF